MAAPNPFDQFDTAPTGAVYGAPPSAKTAAETTNTRATTAKTGQEVDQSGALFPSKLRKDTAEATTAEIAAQEKQRKTADEAAQDAVKKNNAMESTRNLYQSVERARGLTSNWSTGGVGGLLEKLPMATQASQLDTVINQEVRGNIFKNWVDALKAVNPQGTSGIGRIMQSEIPLVTGSMGALNPVKMGGDETRASFDKIQNSALRTAAIINGEDPNDHKVIANYRNRFAGDSQQHGDLTPDIARQEYQQQLDTFHQLTKGLPSAAVYQGFQHFQNDPRVIRLRQAMGDSGATPATPALPGGFKIIGRTPKP